ncbi:hypothetical protein NECAME_13134, partial [Necator americanus]
KESVPFVCDPEIDELQSKKLSEFHDVAITALHFMEGDVCSTFLDSLLSILVRNHVTVLTLSCVDAHLLCTVDEFVHFLKETN